MGRILGDRFRGRRMSQFSGSLNHACHRPSSDFCCSVDAAFRRRMRWTRRITRSQHELASGVRLVVDFVRLEQQRADPHLGHLHKQRRHSGHQQHASRLQYAQPRRHPGRLGDGGAFLIESGNLASEYIGVTGSGAFTQSGGTNTAFTFLYLGYNAGSTGSYNLSSSGYLTAGTESIGNSSSGSFTQGGGTNSASTFYVGNSSNSNGLYTLSGGLLTATSGEYVGYGGSGSFTQIAGTSSATFLALQTMPVRPPWTHLEVPAIPPS